MKNIDLHLLTKVSVLYYREGLTHQAISKRLGISRQSVGRFLQKARKEGVVQIHIDSPLLHCTELESQLESRFSLKEAVVVSPAVETEESVKKTLGKAGAEFLMRRVQSGDILGVSWGSTVLECAQHLKPLDTENVTVVQLNGSLDVASYSTRAEYIVDRMARAFNGKMVTISAPMIVDRPEILDSIKSDSRVAAALEMADKSRIAIFGIGDISENSSPYKAGYFDQALIHELGRHGVVGEICGRFYDADGKIAAPEIQQRILAIELDNLKKKKFSVAIAGQPKKIEAIRGLLKGGYSNVLITDETTARELLKY
ncbi:MAG: sugar-binding transcriptional regulator [Chloroflexi bacterium]|nr:sugar-binding transcriptional regulator [Chloroflexota bacterium]